MDYYYGTEKKKKKGTGSTLMQTGKLYAMYVVFYLVPTDRPNNTFICMVISHISYIYCDVGLYNNVYIISILTMAAAGVFFSPSPS